MSSEFVIGVSNFPIEKQRELIDRLKSEGYGWWHWIGDMWFIAPPSDDVSARTIYDIFREYTGNSNIVVMEIESRRVITYGPISEDKNFGSWFGPNFSMKPVTEEDQ